MSVCCFVTLFDDLFCIDLCVYYGHSECVAVWFPLGVSMRVLLILIMSDVVLL